MMKMKRMMRMRVMMKMKSEIQDSTNMEVTIETVMTSPKVLSQASPDR
jgi:hypothetical protein